jgi:DNA invertase Pin-like site-specific DNA recombinase
VRAAVYARVSSEAQRERHTIASQLTTVPEFCQRQGWTVVATYTDDGRTAKAGHLAAREGFTRLLADAAQRKFDIVAVVDFDRLTRSEDLGERGQILGTFQRLGVKVAVANNGQVLDLATSGGDLMASLFAYFSAEENRKRSDRAKRGRARAAKEGRSPGRAPFGLAFRAGKWTHTDDASTVRDIYAAILDGKSISETCRMLNARGQRRWLRPAVHYIATNAAYRGEWTTDGQTVAIPPVVTADEWYAVQSRLAANRSEKSGYTRRCYMLLGMSVCACGARIRAQDSSQRGRTYLYYQCEERWKRADGKPGCGTKAVRLEDAERRAWSKLVEWIESDDLRSMLLAGDSSSDDAALWRRDLDEATRRVGLLDEAETALFGRVRRGLVSQRAADAELERIMNERRLFERQATTAREALGGQVGRAEAVARAIERVETIRKTLPRASAEERRELARILLPRRDSVVFGPDGAIKLNAVLVVEQMTAEVRLSA